MAGAESEEPGAEEGADGAVTPAVFEQWLLGGAVAEQGFVPVDGGAAFRAAGIGQTIEVVVASSAGEFFERGGVAPGEFKFAGGANRIGLAAEVVTTTCAMDVEMDQWPRG